MSYKIRMEPGNGETPPSWIDPTSRDLHHFLDFFDFVARLQDSGLLSSKQIGEMFSLDLEILERNRKHMANFLEARWPALNLLLRMWSLLV